MTESDPTILFYIKKLKKEILTSSQISFMMLCCYAIKKKGKL